MMPVSNVQSALLVMQSRAVSEWGTPPPSESLLWTMKVLFTPMTSVATSGEYAVVVSVAAPTLISMVTQLGGAHKGPKVEEDDVLVLQVVGLHTTNW